MSNIFIDKNRLDWILRTIDIVEKGLFELYRQQDIMIDYKKIGKKYLGMDDLREVHGFLSELKSAVETISTIQFQD